MATLNHTGIQTREEQNVVDQVKQLVRVLLDLLHEDSFVGRVVLGFEQFGKANHRIQWRTDFVAHVCQECLFQRLCLLSFLGLYGQTALGLYHLRHVAAHAEVTLYLSVGIHHRHHVEQQPYRTALLVVQYDFYSQLNGDIELVIQLVEHDRHVLSESW